MDRLSALLAIFQPETQQVRALVLSEHRSVAASQQFNSLYLVDQIGTDAKLQVAQQLYPISQRSLIWLPQGSPHEILTEQTIKLTHIEIAFGETPDNPLLKTLPEVVFISQDEGAAELQAFFQVMLQEAQAQRCGHHAVLNKLAEVLLIKILRHLMSSHTIETGVLGGLSDPKLSKAITAIHQNPAHTWTLSTLAQQAGMSRTGFSQGFKTTMGITPIDYLTHWRMQIARQQLQKGQLSIDEIGSQLGYQSETAFRRAFRRIMGTPPGFFKKEKAAAHLI